MKNCIACNELLEDEANFCSNCGTKQHKTVSEEETIEIPPSKTKEKGKIDIDEISLKLKLEKVFECESDISLMSVSPKCKYLATYHEGDRFSSNLTIWDISSFKKVQNIHSLVTSFAFSPDDKLIVVSGTDSLGSLFGFSGLNCSIKIYNTVEELNQLALGKTWVSLDRNFDYINGLDRLYKSLGKELPCDSLSFSPDGDKIIGILDGIPRLWDTETGQEILKFPKGSVKIYFHQKEDEMISMDDKNIYIWDINIPEVIQTIAIPNTKFKNFVLSKDGKYLAVETDSKELIILDLIDFELLKRFKVGDGNNEINSLAFGSDSNILTFILDNSEIYIWDIINEKKIKSINIEKCSSAFVTPDGKNLIANSGKKIMKWSIKQE